MDTICLYIELLLPPATDATPHSPSASVWVSSHAVLSPWNALRPLPSMLVEIPASFKTGPLCHLPLLPPST